ncbi:MAG: hypothetical protein KIT56_07310 [Gammaproteobacteria bacterium]|nr:hypothetical protein [Gammaproteobacteria bacterium]MCW5583668.1 hypothetical protein [Gammaproteobacteria bacterium]
MSSKFFGNMFRSVSYASISAFVISGCVNENKLPQQAYQQNMALNSVETSAPAQPPIVSDKHVTLSNFNMNNQGNRIIVKPGTVIQATMSYHYHCPNCYQSLNNQIIIGLAKRSAQACIYNGGPQGEGSTNFTLKVPAKPGKYEVRFRGLQAMDCNEALKAGWNADNSPSKETTIGLIIASKKAEAHALS